MKIKINVNIISGFLFLIISIVLLLLLPSQIATKETTIVTAQTVPKLMLQGILIFSVVLLVQGLFFDKKTVWTFSLSNEKVRTELRSLVFVGMLILYAVLFQYAGFIISSLLLVTGILIYYRVKTWWFYLVAYTNIAFIYVVFGMLLRVSLP